MFALALLAALGATAAAGSADPAYDRQTQAYRGWRTTASTRLPVTATPFFSPVSSSSTLVALLDSAQTSIDVGTPGFDSWSGCTPYEGCQGCAPADMRNESFPIFPALLNALHRGVAVRILTPDFGEQDCPGRLSPLAFLALNGAQIGFFDAVTFQHAKYISVDGQRVAVSSVNFSFSSFLKNREAGAVLDGPGAAELIEFTQGVFEADWAQALPPPAPQDWSAAELAVIQNRTAVPVPEAWTPLDLDGYYSPPSDPQPVGPDANATWTVYTSPDHAFETLMAELNATQRSLDVYIYQVTEPHVCALLADVAERGAAVRLLVSEAVYDNGDCLLADQCYANLTARGLTVMKTPQVYSFAHQKFWIRDGRALGWSTGNMSPSDIAHAADPADERYPPFGEPGWQVVNRDFSLVTTAPSVIDVFQQLMDGDIADPGVYPWTEKYRLYCYPADDDDGGW